MRVAFGTTLLDRGLNNPSGDGIDGIGQYCQELLEHYQTIPASPNIIPFSFGHKFSPSHAQLLPNYSTYLLKEISSLTDPIFQNVDLVHSTDQFIPITQKPLIATVMDVIPLSHPQYIKSQSRYIKAFFWKKLTQRADRIITISEFSKEEIIRHLNFSAEKIDVIPLGVNQRYFKLIDSDERKSLLSSLGINGPFFLFLGSIQPRKNLLRLLEAHKKLPGDLARSHPLVIAGKLAWDDGNISTSIKQGVLEGRVRQLNYINESEKQCLLQSATALAFVSLYEGFGLPIVEAFASGLPVITSNCTSMPEIAKKAAVIVDPRNINQITEALLSLIEDGNLVDQLKHASSARAHEFSWEKNAIKTMEVYIKALR